MFFWKTVRSTFPNYFDEISEKEDKMAESLGNIFHKCHAVLRDS